MIQFLNSELIQGQTSKQTHSRIIALSAVESLEHRASDQAIQNMNIIFDLEETLGLS
jgi:N-acetyl-gamma-glutamylphosphate reductase